VSAANVRVIRSAVTVSTAASRARAVVGRRTARLDELRAWLPALRYCGVVYLVARIALILLGAAAWGLTSEQNSVGPNGKVTALTNGWHNAITGWNKQDSLWFLHIASHGYSASNDSAAFFPAYPMLIRLVGYLTGGHLLVAAYLVSNGALLAALIIFYRLTEREYDLATARRAVLYLAIFPTAFFLFDTYSEALFLLFAVGAISLARRGRWWWAGLAGAGATLTRGVGVVLVLALAAEAVHQVVEERRRTGNAPSPRARTLAAARRLVASVLPLAGVGGYLLFWQLRYHDWYQPLRLENSVWGRVFTAPWYTLWQGLTMAWRYGPVADEGWWMLDLVLVAAGLALGVWVAVRTRPVYAVYTWGSILLFLCEAWPDRPLMSDPRFLVVIFPLVWPLARLGRRSGWHEAVLAVSAASMAIVGWLFLSTTLVF
jgi:Mannosyltransferase (PIG-V)